MQPGANGGILQPRSCRDVEVAALSDEEKIVERGHGALDRREEVVEENDVGVHVAPQRALCDRRGAFERAVEARCATHVSGKPTDVRDAGRSRALLDPLLVPDEDDLNVVPQPEPTLDRVPLDIADAAAKRLRHREDRQHAREGTGSLGAPRALPYDARGGQTQLSMMTRVTPVQRLVSSLPHRSGRADGTLPVHFFTIVLNGEPFIRYHLDVFRRLTFPWRWHIVEGVASLVHDTAWSVEAGGRIDHAAHAGGLSIDGTTAYLDKIAADEPERVSLYRKPGRAFWDGKREMVSAPLQNIREECLLWQVDADELWTAEQLVSIRRLFLDQPDRPPRTTGAITSPRRERSSRLATTTRRIRRSTGCAHGGTGRETDGRPMSRRFWSGPSRRRRRRREEEPVPPRRDGTSRRRVPALRLRDGSAGSVQGDLLRLQRRGREVACAPRGGREQPRARYGSGTTFPGCRTTRSSTAPRDDTSAPRAEGDDGTWSFTGGAVRLGATADTIPRRFHRRRRGVLPARPEQRDRACLAFVPPGVAEDGIRGTCRLPRPWRRRAAARRSADTLDSLWRDDLTAQDPSLQRICDAERAALFVSTYYTAPIATPSLMLVYDLIPERLGLEMTDPVWAEKRLAIEHASAYACISENTRRDLLDWNRRRAANRP